MLSGAWYNIIQYYIFLLIVKKNVVPFYNLTIIYSIGIYYYQYYIKTAILVLFKQKLMNNFPL